MKQLSPIGKSDHVSIIFDIQGYTRKHKHCNVNYAYNKGNYEEMNNELSSIDWENEFRGKSLSVSPSPKKRHGKVAKKGHFERAATCQKGTFSVRRQAKGHFFKWPISCYEGTFKYRSLNLTLNI